MRPAQIIDLRTLDSEHSRIAGLLAGNKDWQALQRLAPAATEERRRLETALEDNSLYQAWRKIGEALSLLRQFAPITVESAALLGDVTELMRIKSIDRDLAERLVAASVTGPAQIAAWTAKDVRRVRTMLGLGRRISQECWIEQAALLLLKPPVATIAAADAAPIVSTVPHGVSAAAPVGILPTASAVTTDEDPQLPSRQEPEAATGTEPLAPAGRMPVDAPPGSLTARLFARTPILGAQRSLLAAIEAAEQARGRQGGTVRERPSDHFSAMPSSAARTDQAQQAPALMATPTAPVVTPRLSDAARVSPSSQAAPAADIAATFGAPVLDDAAPVRVTPVPSTTTRPVLAPIEEEAEVTIRAVAPTASAEISRVLPASAARRPAASQPNSGAILDMNPEAQGGEDIGEHGAAVFRGSIEEAAVEIVVRAHAKPAARSAAPPTDRPSRSRFRPR